MWVAAPAPTACSNLPGTIGGLESTRFCGILERRQLHLRVDLNRASSPALTASGLCDRIEVVDHLRIRDVLNRRAHHPRSRALSVPNIELPLTVDLRVVPGIC